MTSSESSPVFTLSRTFGAPRELVWRAWTEQAHLGRWMSPAGLTPLRSTLDLRPGGTFHYGLGLPDGREMWGRWVFREVTPPERLVFVSAFTDAAAGVIRHPLAADWPLQVLTTLTFSEQDRQGRPTQATPIQTTLTMTATPQDASEGERRAFEEAFGGMEQGWAGTFSQLDALLANMA